MRTRSEGVRRLSLLLGLAGGLLGCLFSFVFLQDLARRKAAKEALSLQDQKAFRKGWDAAIEDRGEKDSGLSIREQFQAFTDATEGLSVREEKAYYEGRDAAREALSLQDEKVFGENEGFEYTPPKPSPKPLAFAEYLPIAALPVVGFLIPWGGIRVIAWVIEGFLADRKRNRGSHLDPGAPP